MGFDQFTIFFFVACLATGVMLFLAFYSWRYRSAQDAITFSLLLLVISIWTGAIACGMLTRTIEANFFWAIIRMIAVIVVPIFWLIFSFQFSGHDELVTPSLVFLISILPLISILLMVTSRQQDFFIKEIQIFQVTPAIVDDVWVLGPWFWVHVIYSYALILAGDYLIFRQAISMSPKFRWQAVMILFAVIFPLFSNASLVMGWFPLLQVNYDPLGFVISGIFFSISLFEFRLFEIKPIARQLLIDNMRDGMLVLDRQKRIVDINQAALDIFGVNVKDYFGKTFDQLPLSQVDMALFQQKLEENNSQMDWREQGFVFDLSFSHVKRRGKMFGYLLVLRDITRRKQMEEELKELAFTDSLTGLVNHRNLFKSGEQELQRALRYLHPLVILMLDIDDFKIINDTYGHQVGDQVLFEISQIFNRSLRQYDIAARYGGEEFVFVLPEIDLQNGLLMAERVRKTIEEFNILHESTSLKITVSIGVSSLENFASEITFADLIRQADQALYFSKKTGKNRVTAWQQPDE